MLKKRFLTRELILFLGLFSGCFVFCFESYDTLNGEKVTKENICTFAEKAPQELSHCVTIFFRDNPKLYELLVRQDVAWEDFGDIFMKGMAFLERQWSNLGNMSYVFKLPSQNFLIKACGPIDRALSIAVDSGLGIKSMYMRIIEQKTDDGLKKTLKYMGFDEDKERIRKYFYICCPKWFLMQTPSKKQREKLVTLIAGAMPKSGIRGVVNYELYNRYIKNGSTIYNSIEEAFNEFLDFAFDLIPEHCYNKSDLIDAKIGDTYKIAGRMFHYLRFKEAIKKFNLHRLEDPPASYIVNVNSHKPNSISDKDVLFVQEILQNHELIESYLKNQKELDKIFDCEALTQLLIAIKYAGLWDISEKNIFVNKSTKKITYIDFEHDRDVASSELFNRSKRRLQKNLYGALIRLLSMFPFGSKQQKTVMKFRRNYKDDIDFGSYVKECREKPDKKSKFIKVGPLGRLLCFNHPESDDYFELRKAVIATLW